MTIINPPSWLDGGAYNSRNDRLVPGALLSQHGVTGVDQLTVSAGGLMTVNVSAGSAFIMRGTGGNTPNLGAYVVRNDGTVNVQIGPAPTAAGQSRFDKIILQIYDATYSGSTNEAKIEVVPGTASTTPVAPAIPDNAIELATITVGNSVSSISAAAISYATRDFAQIPSSMVGGGLLTPSIAIYTSNATWTNPPTCVAIRVRMAGGGGAGGGAPVTAAGQVSGGSGGGAGSYSEAWFNAITLPATVAVTVGTGGTGNLGANGDPGTTSSFGAFLTAPGGGGGTTAAATTGVTAVTPGPGGGTGGVSGASGGVIRIGGGTGERAFIYGTAGVGVTAGGGYNPLGAGATQANLNGAGAAGGVGGGGGAGTVNLASQATARTGGNGGVGLVIIEQFFS
jgi:hypothetical protein